MAARRFDRPAAGNMKTPTQIVRYHDRHLTGLEKNIGDIETAQTDLAAQQSDLASTQNDLASTLVKLKIGLSWISPEDVLSADDVGSNCTITIANHTRNYGDGTSLSITGSTITNRSFSTEYHIYYNDSGLSDTTPSFQSTTNPNTAAANRTNGRHYVGSITTPADGGGSTSGTGPTPPGYGGTGQIP